MIPQHSVTDFKGNNAIKTRHLSTTVQNIWSANDNKYRYLRTYIIKYKTLSVGMSKDVFETLNQIANYAELLKEICKAIYTHIRNRSYDMKRTFAFWRDFIKEVFEAKIDSLFINGNHTYYIYVLENQNKILNQVIKDIFDEYILTINRKYPVWYE